MIGFLNWGGECLLRGTPWVFILDRMRFVCKGLIDTDHMNKGSQWKHIKLFVLIHLEYMGATVCVRNQKGIMNGMLFGFSIREGNAVLSLLCMYNKMKLISMEFIPLHCDKLAADLCTTIRHNKFWNPAMLAVCLVVFDHPHALKYAI
jgi:hypothetical protein